jgi:anti-sigma factor RsiW
MIDWCDKCEEMMQPYLDGSLSDAEVEQAKHHLEQCSWCAMRLQFEESLWDYVRVAIGEPMSGELKAKLSALRTPLDA